MYWEIPKSDILTLDEVQKYSATLRNSLEGENLIEKVCATHEEVTKSLTHAQAYQTRTFNKSHRDVKYKVGQKIWLTV